MAPTEKNSKHSKNNFPLTHEKVSIRSLKCNTFHNNPKINGSSSKTLHTSSQSHMQQKKSEKRKKTEKGSRWKTKRKTSTQANILFIIVFTKISIFQGGKLARK